MTLGPRVQDVANHLVQKPKVPYEKQTRMAVTRTRSRQRRAGASRLHLELERSGVFSVRRLDSD